MFLSLLKLLKEFQSTYLDFHAQDFSLSQSATGSRHLSPVTTNAYMSLLWTLRMCQTTVHSLSSYFWEVQRRVHVSFVLSHSWRTSWNSRSRSDSLQWSIQLCSWRAWLLYVECGVIFYPYGTWDMGVLRQGPQLCPRCHGTLMCLVSVLFHRSVLKGSLSSANVKRYLWRTSLDMFLNMSCPLGSQY